MRKGHASRTAFTVCAARAIIAAYPTIRDFEEPYAERLLPRSYKTRAVRAAWRTIRHAAHIIGLRMVAIDDALLAAPKLEQIVILGAGLDARAWRLPQLADVPVFEVDHPDTQAYKQRKASDFGALAHHHYVAVDFTRQSLDEELERAGHRANVPTVWIWEGVTMYLELNAIEATLDVVSARSAEGSRIITSYLPPGISRNLVGFGTSLVGEPLRATLKSAEIERLLNAGGFDVTSDESAREWHARWATPKAVLLPGFSATERLVTADLS